MSERDELPKRNPHELAVALLVRSEKLSGQSWEVAATCDMMREAAYLLDAISNNLTQLRDEMRHSVRSSVTTSEAGTWRVQYSVAEAIITRWIDTLDQILQSRPGQE